MKNPGAAASPNPPTPLSRLTASVGSDRRLYRHDIQGKLDRARQHAGARRRAHLQEGTRDAITKGIGTKLLRFRQENIDKWLSEGANNGKNH